MPLVHIKLLPGRTDEQKQQLTERVTAAFEDVLGIPPDGTWTIYEEVEAEDWYMRNQSIASKRKT